MDLKELWFLSPYVKSQFFVSGQDNTSTFPQNGKLGRLCELPIHIPGQNSFYLLRFPLVFPLVSSVVKIFVNVRLVSLSMRICVLILIRWPTDCPESSDWLTAYVCTCEDAFTNVDASAPTKGQPIHHVHVQHQSKLINIWLKCKIAFYVSLEFIEVF